MSKESRFHILGTAKLEQRAEGDEGLPTITGYGAVFYREDDPGTEYKFEGFWDKFAERIMPSAFDNAIKEDDVRGLFNHNPSMILGRTSAGTMNLSVDATGLRYDITPPDTQAGRDVVEAIRRGDINGSSFTFVAEDVTYREQKQEDDSILVIRELHRAKLYDVGPVTFPAYESSTAGVRSAGELDSVREEYKAWKAEQGPPLAARLAQYRARAVEVTT